MKRRYKALMLAFMLGAALCGCTKKTVAAYDGESARMPGFSMSTMSNVYSDAGVLYLDTGSWSLSFFDPASGADAPLCARVNCDHASADCDANFGVLDFAAVMGDSLYYVGEDNGMKDRVIGRADIGGNGRRTLHRLKNAQIGSAGGCEEGYLFYAYYNQYDENGEVLEKYDPGLCLLDLRTEELTQIDLPDDYQGRVMQATIYQGALYYHYLYSRVNLQDYSYEEIQSAQESLLQEQRQELWKYEIATGEKTCLWSKSGSEAGGILRLGYGWFYGNCFDGMGHLERLGTGEVRELDAALTKNASACLSDEGVVLAADGELSLWRFDTGKLIPLGSCSETGGVLSLCCVTEHWVYARRFDSDSDSVEDLYLPREQLLNGELEWRHENAPSVPEESETQESDSEAADYLREIPMGKYADIPGDQIVTWAVPSSLSGNLTVTEEMLEAFNEKLEADGYPFLLKIVSYDTGDPQSFNETRSAGQILAALQRCDADIATLFPTGSDERMAEHAQAMGLMEALDERLAGSRLYDAIPELCWESVRYQGSICYIPSERAQDEGLQLYINRGIAADFPAQSDGDLFGLGDYLSADAPLYYSVSGFKYAEALGYIWDPQSGLLFAGDQTPVNPLEEESVVEWLRSINRWYHEGKVQILNPRRKNKSAVLLADASLRKTERGDWQAYYSWKGYAFHRIGAAAGICASSGKKDAAFALLELLHTDHDYGNLLVYGQQAFEDGEEQEHLMTNFTPVLFGLNTGLKWRGNWENDLFSNIDEKKQYYKEHILPSPGLYLDISEEYCRIITEIENRYLEPEQIQNGINPASSILTCDDFDAKLKEFREELKKPIDEVLEKLAAQ